MKSKFLALMLALLGCYFPSAYALQDLTGIDGKFTAVDTMYLDKKNSTDKIVGYAFAPGFIIKN